MLNISLQTVITFFGSASNPLLVVIVLVVIVVVVMAVMMMVLSCDHHLRLRRIRCCEAEDESQCEKDLFHASSMTRSTANCRSTLTCEREITAAQNPKNAALKTHRPGRPMGAGGFMVLYRYLCIAS
jgi:hypothetical protein